MNTVHSYSTQLFSAFLPLLPEFQPFKPVRTVVADLLILYSNSVEIQSSVGPVPHRVCWKGKRMSVRRGGWFMDWAGFVEDVEAVS